ncbi:unnamed protein product [Rhizophagus irregularis]|uniref:HMG box domain-containing protein n=1 Tax=Rhizophagus irregularis TaxID=588596 RepID=A0A916DXQ1_9GLOM|nr:unnamed protein product [Rhizophagus irregularis]CAB5361610.1 unnamed protein product [Rhizophagus irregularis]
MIIRDIYFFVIILEQRNIPPLVKRNTHTYTQKIYTMNTNTTDQEYFKQEAVSMWPSPSTPSDISSPSNSASPNHDYNVYHVPRGFDVVLVPLKVEEQTYPDNACSESSIDSPLEPTSSSATKPMDIPKSKTPSSTDAKASSTTATTTTRLSAYRKRKADKNYIPRPKNCFMAYREHIKEKFLSENPGMNNKVVSVLAANMWNNEPEDVKELWRERAKQLKLEHKLKYPDYKFKPQKKKQNLKTPGSTKTSSKTTNARNNKKSNSDSKIIFTDSGYGSEILGDSDDGKHIYHHPIGLEGNDEQEEIYLTHIQKKALFGHYRASSVDSVSSWTSDSTASTPLLSPFARSPASLSPPTFQFGSQFGRSSSALRYEAAHNHNEDSQPTSTDYDLMAMGHFTTSPTEEQGGFFHDYDNTESAYHNHVYNSSFELSSSQEGQSTLAEHYALVLETPRRNSQQLLADFQHGLKQQEMLLQGL